MNAEDLMDLDDDSDNDTPKTKEEEAKKIIQDVEDEPRCKPALHAEQNRRREHNTFRPRLHRDPWKNEARSLLAKNVQI